MGKILTTSYFDTNDSILNLHSNLLQNPFYTFNDKKGLSVTYYNINNEKTTLDPGSKLAYTDIGRQSPIRFNMIKNMYLYQFTKAELNFDNGDFGLESDGIKGESYIIPNTIIPCDGDFFEVDHIKDSTWLFKVTDVQKDTLENGVNMYKISWTLDRTTNREILQNIVKIFRYIDYVEGTNLKAVVEEEKYEIANYLDNLSVTLGKYFKELFYNDKVQTFIYKWYTEHNMYDPFAIEFILRNRIFMTDSDSYTFIDHKTVLPASFTIDYNKTVFKRFEERDKEKLHCCKRMSQANYIDDLTSIFSTRYEAYFALDYSVLNQENGPFNPKDIIPILDDDFCDMIIENRLYDEKDYYSYRNLIIKYFNKYDHITIEDVKNLELVDYVTDREIFYDMLFLIYVIDFYIKKLLS